MNEFMCSGFTTDVLDEFTCYMNSLNAIMDGKVSEVMYCMNSLHK